MSSTLIIGAQGMLGQELVRVFSANANYGVVAWDRDEIDITDEAQVKEKIGALAPDVIINAAAYNAVDKIEDDRGYDSDHDSIPNACDVCPGTVAGIPVLLEGDNIGCVDPFLLFLRDRLIDLSDEPTVAEKIYLLAKVGKRVKQEVSR